MNSIAHFFLVRCQATWDFEAKLPAVESLSFQMAKARLIDYESDTDPDPFVSCLLDFASKGVSHREQEMFMAAVMFKEHQDILAKQR